MVSSLGYGDRVGVAVLYAAPNRGSRVADVVLGNVTGVGADVVASLVALLGEIMGTGSDQDLREAVHDLSMEWVQREFNPANPDDPAVTYWSWAGETCSLFDPACIASHDGEIVEPALSASFAVLSVEGEGTGPNDGMVTVESASWGELRGVVFADHYDEVGQIADADNPAFDHLAFFRSMAAEMLAEGF
jgi:triacylglycerol lipase